MRQPKKCWNSEMKKGKVLTTNELRCRIFKELQDQDLQEMAEAQKAGNGSLQREIEELKAAAKEREEDPEFFRLVTKNVYEMDLRITNSTQTI